jgi:ketosteroid isomerase-like protein
MYKALTRRKALRASVDKLMALSFLFAFSTSTAALAAPPSTTAAPSSVDETKTDSNLEPDREKYKAEHQEIDAFLGDIETNWNAHNLDAVMNFYHDDYVNNDGLNKNAVKELTKDFWKTYPDAKSVSKTKQIRVEGKFATVESRDKAVGSTDKIMPGIGTKGTLSSISEGQLYLKKLGKEWKIVGDRIDYEKVRVAFGLAQQLDTSFIAPEQVKSGQEYSARLKVELPNDLIAVGSITSEPLRYPQPAHKDFWRPIDNQVLERIIHANTSNHNELLMATIGITDKSRSNLKGLTYLTRRLNVVPETKDAPPEPKPVQTATIDEDDTSPIKLTPTRAEPTPKSEEKDTEEKKESTDDDDKK